MVPTFFLEKGLYFLGVHILNLEVHKSPVHPLSCANEFIDQLITHCKNIINVPGIGNGNKKI
jgi:hypothetical protein